MCLLFIRQVIYENGEPWWDVDGDRRKLLIRLPELSVNLTSGVIW
jgi:hypothetical protein